MGNRIGRFGPPSIDAASCFREEPGFAWNHGDFQNQITQTWLGFVGPGIRDQGEIGTFTDHTDIRPTILRLVGLKDDYAHDGRVLAEAIHDHSLPSSLREYKDTFEKLANAYKQINAPRGALGVSTLSGISTSFTCGITILATNPAKCRSEVSDPLPQGQRRGSIHIVYGQVQRSCRSAQTDS
jgi:hypothetical protein